MTKDGEILTFLRYLKEFHPQHEAKILTLIHLLWEYGITDEVFTSRLLQVEANIFEEKRLLYLVEGAAPQDGMLGVIPESRLRHLANHPKWAPKDWPKAKAENAESPSSDD